MAKAQQLVDELDAVFRALGRSDRAASEKKYLKSKLEFYGCTVPAMRSALKDAVRSHQPLDNATLVEMVELLWSVPVHERRMAAVELLDMCVARLEPGDLVLVERLIRESKTWALVDTLAPAVAGPLVVRFPELNKTLDRWAGDDDFWVRRASLLALLEPLRRGGGDWERFTRYAEMMLDEKEFFIRKAIGWILREVSKKRPQIVFDWLAPRCGRASGVTMREAAQYLPAAQAEAVMTAYKEQRAV